ncbi:hypothetical protein [Kordia sp.]|uniref:hypothetical protein n=1 Tax=Kordia sp. TaxID=1965332 RepID=UPI003D2773E3
MKKSFILKFICTSCIVLLLNFSWKVTAQNLTVEQQDFIILKNKDTIYGEKIKNIRWFYKLGRITVVKENEEKLTYGFNEVYQLHKFNRKGKKSVYELVKEFKQDENSYEIMDMSINQGKVKLYYNDSGQWADRPFVVSDIFYGYAYKRSYKKFLKQLDKCKAFREKFNNNKQRRKKHIEKLIQFYNTNCE